MWKIVRNLQPCVNIFYVLLAREETKKKKDCVATDEGKYISSFIFFFCCMYVDVYDLRNYFHEGSKERKNIIQDDFPSFNEIYMIVNCFSVPFFSVNNKTTNKNSPHAF